MPLSNAFIQGILDLLFNNSAMADIGDVAGLQPSATTGNFWVALHSADPGAGGSQSTSEVSYTGYARVAVVRTSSGWVRTGNTYDPAATIVFGACTAGSATAAYASIGSASSGAGNLWWSGPITPNITIAAGVTPELTTGSTITLA